MKDKATIYINSIQLNELMKHYNYINRYCQKIDFDEYKLVVNEETLSRLLFYLPNNHELRPYLQKAGENIFKW